MARNNEDAKEWGPLSARALNPLCTSYEPKINSMTVQVERNGAVAQVETGDQEREGNEDREGATRQAKVLDESKVDVSVHGF